jgi:hypothetical protein
MPDLPSGTVTFLYTDIEGSTALWEQDQVAMATAVARHLTLLRAAIAGSVLRAFCWRSSVNSSSENGSNDSILMGIWVSVVPCCRAGAARTTHSACSN